MSETKNSRQYNVFTVEQGDFSRESGKAAMLRILEKHKDDIDVLFAMNDDMALGAIEAMEELKQARMFLWFQLMQLKKC